MNTIGQVNAAIYRNMQMLISSRLSELNIKNGQYDFFFVISLNEGISQKQLSGHLHIGKSTTAKAVKNLVSKGYVIKHKDKKDVRVDHLYLTELGRKEAPTVAKIFQENLDIASKGLSDEESEQLLFLMNKVLNNLITENATLSGRDIEIE